MLNFKNLPSLLTGKSRQHLVALPNKLSDQHALQSEVVKAFLHLQDAALKAGFNLQPASTYRDFERQKWIWNTKFNGENKVHDDHGKAIILTGLGDWDKCQAILRWSAVPGASRHHWGTEIDIFDPTLLPEGKKLMLEPWEYQTGGYFQHLTNWLLVNAERFGFYFPFMEANNKFIGLEPWHMSYFPISEQYERLLSPEILQMAWQGENIAGVNSLNEHISELFEYYIL
ncbi:M15 family metallopeptidase [Glaesserella parasuis]|uniref:M15 family metallopeptidase n=2 Tax=Glaesserella parasuis TaxID=738 RepID=UPI0003AC335D|nr:M15 family metallopeptidase [Glaesserella parasuis]ATW43574.1 peptidase M15 [Glaesserella parasuis D74]EQA08993.1 D-alanyl-D-alanine carboxypeptidase family protein [Glaesserella parasuis D74]KDB44957.1 peptidase M15 [Glaesserella parasuis HPS11]MCT8562008.1 M15 family metallopeptidase [Glaesserella parasuis]MCT8579485.1 M15 family metallopeptidase [Glaesserella parasuis]